MSYLRHLCLFAHSGVQPILCCVFVLFVFVLSLVHPMLPISMECLFLFASSVLWNVYLYNMCDFYFGFEDDILFNNMTILCTVIHSR